MEYFECILVDCMFFLELLIFSSRNRIWINKLHYLCKKKGAAKSQSVIFLSAKMLSDVSFTVWVFLNVFSNFPDTVS